MKIKIIDHICLKKRLSILLSLMAVALMVWGCYSAPKQDPELLRQARDLKAESISLMKQAVEPFDKHKSEIDVLMEKLNASKERADSRGGKISMKQWEILLDPQADSFGGFLKLWQEQSTLSQSYIDGKIKYIGDNFDQIIKLESGLAR
jgi:hypothetical protein